MEDPSLHGGVRSMRGVTRILTVAVRYGLAAIVVITSVEAGGAAQTLASTEAARSLVAALERAGQTAVAGPDPTLPGAFAAALYIPGSQLLVVSAQHPSGDAITYRLAQGEHREVYLDLQGTPTPDRKFFVQDADADGIRSGTDGSVDVVYDDGVRQTIFDGKPEEHELTDTEYELRLRAADERYAKLLNALASMVEQPTSTPR